MSRALRRQIYRQLLFTPINYLGRAIFSVLPLSVSARGTYVFPLKGNLRIDYGKYGAFHMLTNGSDSIASRAFFCGALQYEAATAKCLTALFADGEVFFDVGANTGICSLMAANHPNIKSIHSFEPVGSIASCLRANFELNKIFHAKAHQLALSRHSGRLRFQIPKETIVLPLGSSEAGSTKGFDDDVEVVEVEAISLDDFVKEYQVRPDIIKIDTETTEPDVIAGGLEFIKSHRPSLVVEVLNDKVGRDIETLMAGLDYEFLFLTDEGHFSVPTIQRDQNLKYLNYALIPKEKVASYRLRLQELLPH